MVWCKAYFDILNHHLEPFRRGSRIVAGGRTHRHFRSKCCALGEIWEGRAMLHLHTSYFRFRVENRPYTIAKSYRLHFYRRQYGSNFNHCDVLRWKFPNLVI